MEHQYPEYFLNRITAEQPSSLTQFDAAKFSLYDTSIFRENTDKGEAVDKSKFLENIKTCRWYGPYKDIKDDGFLFFSFNDSGNNEYKVRLQIWFEKKNVGFNR